MRASGIITLATTLALTTLTTACTTNPYTGEQQASKAI